MDIFGKLKEMENEGKEGRKLEINVEVYYLWFYGTTLEFMTQPINVKKHIFIFSIKEDIGHEN